MSRYQKGQSVYMGRGDKLRELVVERVHNNPLIPVFQYTFEAPNDGFACGEQSIRGTKNGKDRTVGQSYKEDYQIDMATNINTMASATGKSVNGDDQGYGGIFSDTDVQFRPDLKLVKWLKDYANGRIIIDVGCGQGHLVNMVKMTGAKVIGIEPKFNHQEWVKWRGLYRHNDALPDINEILPRKIEDCKKLINGMGASNVLMVFARPNDGEFVDVAIRNMAKDMEALLITTPENIKKYNVLGEYVLKAEPIEHEGQSEGNEVMLLIKK